MMRVFHWIISRMTPPPPPFLIQLSPSRTWFIFHFFLVCLHPWLPLARNTSSKLITTLTASARIDVTNALTSLWFPVPLVSWQDEEARGALARARASPVHVTHVPVWSVSQVRPVPHRIRRWAATPSWSPSPFDRPLSYCAPADVTLPHFCSASAAENQTGKGRRKQGKGKQG